MASLTPSGDELRELVADRDLLVQDPNTSDTSYKVQIVAGQVVPGNLRDAYLTEPGPVLAVKAVRGPVVDKAERAPGRTK